MNIQDVFERQPSKERPESWGKSPPEGPDMEFSQALLVLG